ncbi:hypothetical protein GCM10011571_34850 [Marinithermofilum abyssi]|uniref:Helix-turn-helix domain-containing protein n=1 Tax=Marinithermofilum abyssi TaxID=1571185 RepID=A0A8J2YEW6_9BACL|nr:hypothetical protein [Marinithermofilum abyssi]GGE29700.1 hypothetical protein GCM10011571_34850 [Marinithermofilum abyssi]
MSRLVRGWKKDEFSAPSSIWKTALDTKAKITYLYLVHCMDNGDDCPPHSEIARACSFSTKTSERATDILHKYGLVQKIHRKKPGKKEKDSNLYIVHHPDQVSGLPWIESQEEQRKNKGTDMMSVGGTDTESVGTDMMSVGGTDTESIPTDSVSELSQSVKSVSPSVNNTDPSDPIKEYWKKAFKENISELELEEIYSFELPIQKLKDIIRRVALYTDIKTRPFAVVIKAVAAAAQGHEWEWNENVVAIKENNQKQRKKRNFPSGKKVPPNRRKEDQLPQAVQQGLENKDKNNPDFEVDPAAEKRLRKKLDRMNNRLDSKKADQA